MSRRAELGDVAEVRGRLARVISINEGNREIGFEFIGSQPCPTCGKPDRIDINEGCLNWREWVKPVTTVPESKSFLPYPIENLIGVERVRPSDQE